MKSRIGLLGIEPNPNKQRQYSVFCWSPGNYGATKSSSPFLISRCFKSVKAGQQVDVHSDEDEDEIQVLVSIYSLSKSCSFFNL